MGEGKQFKEYESRVAADQPRSSRRWSCSSDDELRKAGRRAARARQGRRVARRPAARGLRAHPRGRPPHPRPAPLRRPADRRHGPALRRDRRDEDRRGQDPDRDPAGLPQHPRRATPSTWSRSTTTSPAATPSGWPRSTRPSGSPSSAIQEGDDPRDPAREVRLRRHLRHQLGVRLRLPARQHGRLARGVRPARPRLRDRRRGRQHPHRRGADPADHLRPARAGRRPLLHLRPPGEADGGGAGEDRS